MNINKISQKLTRNLKIASTFLVLQFAMSTNGYAIKLVIDGEPAIPNNTVLNLTDDVVYGYDDAFRPVVTNTDLPFLCLGPKLVGGGSNPNVSFGMSSSDMFKVQGLVGVSSVTYDYNPALLSEKEVQIQTTDDSQCVVDGYVSNIVIPDVIFTNGFEDGSSVIVNPREITLEILDINDQVLSRNSSVTHNNDLTYKYKITNNTSDVTSVSMADYYNRSPVVGQPHFSTVLSENIWSCAPSTAASDCDTTDVNPISGEQGEVYLSDIELAANEFVVITVTRKPIVTSNGSTISLLATALVTNGTDIVLSDNSDTRIFSVSTIQPTKLVITTQPTSTFLAGANISDITVEIQDVNSNLDTGNTSNVTISIANDPSVGGALFGSSLTVAATAGIATFSNLKLDKIGPGYTLSVSSGVLTGATTSGFDITANAATNLFFAQQPTETNLATTISPAIIVELHDAYDNLTTLSDGSLVAIGINPFLGLPGVLSGANPPQTVTNGSVTFNNLSISLNAVGYQLTATSDIVTIPAQNSALFDITTIPDANMSEFGASTNSETVDTVVTYSATIKDSSGNLVGAGNLVSFTMVNSLGVTTPNVTCMTSAVGVCSATASSSIIGTTIVSASVNGGNIATVTGGLFSTTTWVAGIADFATSTFGVNLNSQNAGTDVIYSAVVKDTNGNLVADNTTVIFILTNSSGATAPTAILSCTTISGTCSIDETSNTTGDTQVQAALGFPITAANEITTITSGLFNTTNWF